MTTAPSEIDAPSEKWGPIDIVEIAVISWRALSSVRASRHQTNLGCPTVNAPYGPSDLDGRRAHPACESTGCVDLHHDLMLRVQDKLIRHKELNPVARIENLPAFASRVARTELVEMQRAERVKRGYAAKPTRNDGAASRINRVLQHHDELGDWLVALFRILRAYPFSGHRSRVGWPVEGLVEERRKFLPGGDQGTVRREIDVVLACASEEAGRAWVYNNLIGPLLSSGEHLELESDHWDGVASDHEDHVIISQVIEAYWRYRWNGYGRHEGFAAACQEVCQVSPSHESDIGAALDDLEFLRA